VINFAYLHSIFIQYSFDFEYFPQCFGDLIQRIARPVQMCEHAHKGMHRPAATGPAFAFWQLPARGPDRTAVPTLPRRLKPFELGDQVA
jgi:hypothetical protein